MERVILGRTGLEVTVAGLGCGGHSRLGIEQYGEQHAAGIARKAFDLGVNFFDTSAAYGTEGALGRGLAGIPRGQYVLSSKFPYGGFEGRLKRPEALTDTLDNALRLLNTDYLDVYNLHAVTKEHYVEARDTFMPVLLKAKEQGKLRHIGVTERFGEDTSHGMLKLALADDIFDVIMVGYNFINPSAAKVVLPAALRQNVGVLCMFAVRSGLSDAARLRANLERIAQVGQGGPGFTVSEHVLDFLTEGGAAHSVIDAAYRYCRHSPGITVTLTGTGNAAHLEDNLRSIEHPALPDDILSTLDTLFGGVDCVDLE